MTQALFSPLLYGVAPGLIVSIGCSAVAQTLVRAHRPHKLWKKWKKWYSVWAVYIIPIIIGIITGVWSYSSSSIHDIMSSIPSLTSFE